MVVTWKPSFKSPGVNGSTLHCHTNITATAHHSLMAIPLLLHCSVAVVCCVKLVIAYMMHVALFDLQRLAEKIHCEGEHIFNLVRIGRKSIVWKPASGIAERVWKPASHIAERESGNQPLALQRESLETSLSHCRETVWKPASQRESLETSLSERESGNQPLALQRESLETSLSERESGNQPLALQRESLETSLSH